MQNSHKLRNNTALLATAIMLMVSGCSMNKSVRVPSLPPNIEQPCESLQEFTISKYNRCVAAKNAVTEAYQLIYKEVNNEKP